MNRNNYLEHHGILGMKWGIRRFQNEDGSLTDEGKRRKSKGKNYSEDYWNAHDRKKVEYMSDKELQKRNNRLIQEQQYRNLSKSKKRKTAEAVGKGTVNLGKRFVEKALITAAVGYAATKAKPYVTQGMEYIGRKIRNTLQYKYLI